jgi:hypothetical protein
MEREHRVSSGYFFVSEVYQTFSIDGSALYFERKPITPESG